MTTMDKAEAAALLISERGFTQEKAASWFGVSQPTVAGWIGMLPKDERPVSNMGRPRKEEKPEAPKKAGSTGPFADLRRAALKMGDPGWLDRLSEEGEADPLHIQHAMTDISFLLRQMEQAGEVLLSIPHDPLLDN